MNSDHRTSNDRILAARATGKPRVFDLEDRLLNFASAIIDLCEALPKTRAGHHVAGQLLRSGTSPYANHGEAESAESPTDFIHKMKVCLKELRETRRWLRRVHVKEWLNRPDVLKALLAEVEELFGYLWRVSGRQHGTAQAAAGFPMLQRKPAKRDISVDVGCSMFIVRCSP